MEKEIEIPFGAFDSETIGWAYTIPEGFTAKIEDGKIIVEKKAESEDEIIRKDLIAFICQFSHFAPEHLKVKYVAYLEKQKEQPTNEEMLRTLRTEYEKGVADTIAKYEQNKQQPAEWSEEDESKKERLISIVKRALHGNKYPILNDDGATELITWLKSLRPQPKQEWTDDDEQHLKWLCRIIHSRKNHGELSLTEESELGKWIDKWINHNPQPHWKPSKQQIEALKYTLGNGGFYDKKALDSLLSDLQKLL